MTIYTRYGLGTYAANEGFCLIRPRNWSADRMPVIWCHGANRTAVDGVSTGYADIPRTMGRHYPTIYPDLGGPYTWGNDTALARIPDAITFMSEYADTDKVILMAGSMGGSAACNFARTHLDSIACLALFIPAIDLEDIRANDRAGMAASIETAYGGSAAWQAARPTHNPIEYATDLAGLPIGVWYSDNDPIINKNSVEGFVDLTGAYSHNIGAQGHDVTGLNMDEVLGWVRNAT